MAYAYHRVSTQNLAMELLLLYPRAAAVGLLVLAFVLSFLLWRTANSKQAEVRPIKSRLPVEAGGAWPIIGHLHLLAGGSQLAHIILGGMADKYGPSFTLRLGVHRAVVVSSLEMAKELFTSQDTVVSQRPTSLAAKLLGYNYAMFGFAPYGPFWSEIRKIISQKLLSARRLELLKHVRVSETGISVKELYRESSKGRALVDMKRWFGDLTLNVIIRMIAGKRYFGGAIDVSEEKEARQCQKAARDFFHLVGIYVVADFVPFLGWLDLEGHEKKLKETAKEMDQIVEGWLKEHKRRKESGKGDGQQDFMDVMLSVTQGGQGEIMNLAGGYDADTIVKATCLNLMSGGSDTTAVMLTWALSLLLNNPQVLRKAREELDLHIGKDRRVTESDINNLVYLQAIVKETFRLYPASPLGVTRDFNEDCTFGGGNYHVPKGTRLIFNLWKLQRDPNIWPDDPSEYRPERFLSTHKDVEINGKQFELVPFGAGRRICPGLHFGIQMIHLVLADLLHAFDISKPSDEPVDMTESAGLTNAKATPLDVLIAPRLSPNLY